MLKSAYVIRQFQTKVTKAKSIKDIVAIATKLGIRVTAEIFPRGVWFANYDLTNNTISGVLDLGVKLYLHIGEEVIEISRGSNCIRYDSPEEISVEEWRAKIFQTVYNAIKAR